LINDLLFENYVVLFRRFLDEFVDASWFFVVCGVASLNTKALVDDDLLSYC
jgi:hypothetical protein